MYDRIVVGYDESESSKAALKEASLWTQKRGGSVLVAHAVYFDAEEFAIPPAQLEKGVERAIKFCGDARARISADFGLTSVEAIVREGEAPDVLVDLARAKKADLIALGTFGRSGLKRLIVGSVTADVVAKAPCDVLVVKRPCEECTGSHSSILVSYDRSESSKKALVRAVQLAKDEKAKLTVLYVVPRYEEMVEFLRTSSIERSLREGAEKVVAEARGIASAQGVDAAAEIREGHAAHEIVAAAGKLGSDLVVMGTYGWRGVSKALMGSTTSSVIAHASVPVLVVK